MSSPSSRAVRELSIASDAKASEAPRSSRGEFLWHSSLYSASLLASGALSIVRSYFLARFLGPRAFGTWKMLQIFADYLPLASLGTQAALQQRVPYLRGKKAKLEMETTLRTASSVNVISALVYSAGVYGFSYLLQDAVDAQALAFFAPVVLLFAWLSYTKTYSIVSGRYGFRSKLELVHAVSAAAFSIPLLYFWGLTGAIVGFACSIVLCIGYSAWKLSERFRLSVDLGVLVRLVLTGFPIMANGRLLTTMQNADRIVLAATVGREVLGFYSVAGSVLNILRLIPGSFSPMLFLKFAEVSGEGRPAKQVSWMVEESSAVMTRLFAPVVCLAMATLPLLITLFLPEYRKGIDAGRILTAELFFLTASLPSANWCVSTGRVLPVILCRGLFVTFEFISIFLVVRAGYSLEAVALCVFSASVAFTLCVLVLAKSLLQEGPLAGLRQMAQLLMPFGGVAVTFIAQSWFHSVGEYQPDSTLYLSTCVSLVLGLTFCSPFVYRTLTRPEIVQLFPRVPAIAGQWFRKARPA